MNVGNAKKNSMKVLQLELVKGKKYISDQGKLDLPTWWRQLIAQNVASNATGFCRRRERICFSNFTP